MSEPVSTEELVRRARGHDRAAFDALVERFRPRLEARVRGRMGRFVRSRIEVEDVLQETFLKAFENIDRLEWRGEDDFCRWLGAIAERLIWKLSQETARSHLSLDVDVEGGAISPDRALYREERLERLERALAGLSPDHRQVIELARLERLKVREIAERMGRAPNAVRKLLARALEELKRGYADTSGSLRLPDRLPDREVRRGDSGERRGGDRDG